jgi:hypothetical protein
MSPLRVLIAGGIGLPIRIGRDLVSISEDLS